MTVEKNNPMKKKREQKRAEVLGTKRKSRAPFFSILTSLVLVVTAGGLIILNFSGEDDSVTTQIPATTPEPSTNNSPSNTVTSSLSAEPQGSREARVTFSETLFGDGKAHYFEYKDTSTIIRYFVLKSSDGVIRAAFDACDICWQAGRGYIQSGDLMICRNCRRSFASVDINVLSGGCNPALLERKMENGEVVIRVKDILYGKQYFSFSG